MKAVLHVHQAKMRKGEPAIIVRTYKGSTHHRRVSIIGPAVMIQSLVPDACGARVWVETTTDALDLMQESPQNH